MGALDKESDVNADEDVAPLDHPATLPASHR
jgi:hypothetical protein